MLKAFIIFALIAVSSTVFAQEMGREFVGQKSGKRYEVTVDTGGVNLKDLASGDSAYFPVDPTWSYQYSRTKVTLKSRLREIKKLNVFALNEYSLYGSGYEFFETIRRVGAKYPEFVAGEHMYMYRDQMSAFWCDCPACMVTNSCIRIDSGSPDPDRGIINSHFKSQRH